LCRAEQGGTQVEKLPLLNCDTQFLTVAYNGACFPMYQSEWREFPWVPCVAGNKKNYYISRIDVEIARVA